MGLDCLPRVETCCLCVRNLKTATFLILVYSLILQLPEPLLRVFMNVCIGLHGPHGMALGVYIMEGLFFLVGLALLVGMLILLVTIVNDNPIGMPYVIAQFIYVPVCIILTILTLVRVKELGGCLNKGMDIKRRYEYFYVYFGRSLLSGALHIYFAIVINSYCSK